MLTVSIRRKTLLFLLVAVLITPWASAAGPLSEIPRSVQAGDSASLEIFSRLWSFLVGIRGKEGCRIDPSGLCIQGSDQTAPAQSKAGCRIDPNGRCVIPPTKQGSRIDPNGRCSPPPRKAGCRIDPDGRCLP
jgi:hypothetical protein